MILISSVSGLLSVFQMTWTLALTGIPQGNLFEK